MHELKNKRTGSVIIVACFRISRDNEFRVTFRTNDESENYLDMLRAKCSADEGASDSLRSQRQRLYGCAPAVDSCLMR